jgi:type IV pilus assembly protein PilO
MKYIGVREILFAVLLLAIPAGAWWLVFRPANEVDQETRAQIEVKQQKLRDLNQVIGSVGNLRKQISSLEEAIAVFQSKLPNEKEIDQVLRETWRLAEESKMITKSIRTAQAPPEEQSLYPVSEHSEQPILMHLEGAFEGFYVFLQALESQPRIMRISRMTLTKPPNSREGFVQAKFDMSVFFEAAGRES